MFNKAHASKTLCRFFGIMADREAHNTKLVQRQSKLTGNLFLQILVVGFLERPSASLNYLCQVAEDLGLAISKQGIQKRLTSAAATFMKVMFEHAQEVLQNQVPIPLTLLTQFAVVQLLDSTGITLPDKLANEFPASGGSGPRAGLKLQTMWEFLRGNLTAVWQTTGRESDQGFTDYLTYIVPGGLFLADLGYFVLATLQQVIEKDAYFISRFNTQTVLLHPTTEERFDLLVQLHQMTTPHIELTVLVGLESKLPCRLLAVHLPADVVAERRRKAKEKARKKGRTLSRKALAWLAWSIYITNVPATMLSRQQVVLVYTLRWQVELLFKLWKSEGRLDRVAGFKQERVLCELYAKLIGMIAFHYLTGSVRWRERELSPTKAFQTLRRHILELGQALQSPPVLQRVLTKLIRHWQRFGLKDKRRTRLSTCRQIELATAQAVSPLLLPLMLASSTGEEVHPDNASRSASLFWSLVLTVAFGVELEAMIAPAQNCSSLGTA